MIKTKILIADTYTLTREGIKSVLAKRKDLQVTGEVTNSKELFLKFAQSVPDILIIDFNIPDHFSISDIARLKLEFPDVRVLVISTNQNKEEVLRVLDYGIHGYLLKECDEDEVLKAVYAAAIREKFFCSRVLDTILERVTNNNGFQESNSDNCQAVALSDREVEIIKLIAEGYTTKRIAENLFLSFHTIGTHRKNIFKKLRIKNSSELVRYAIKNGIISSGSSEK